MWDKVMKDWFPKMNAERCVSGFIALIVWCLLLSNYLQWSWPITSIAICVVTLVLIFFAIAANRVHKN